jgi:hypothetical protein
MQDLDKIANDFLLVMPPARMARVRQALGALLPAVREGSIYNSEFVDLKQVLDRAYDEAVETLTGTDFHTYWMPDKITKSPKGILRDTLGGSTGVRGSIFNLKKIAKLQGPEVEAARAFFLACIPMAQILETLKAKVIKGRKPNPEAAARKAAQNANKTIKTCACCFRSIAVLGNGKIADHGYQLPGIDMKTSSCPGQKFKPLEVSDEGLRYMVELLTGRIAQLEERIVTPPNVLYKPTFSKRQGLGDPIPKDTPEWNARLKQHIAGLKAELAATTDRLHEFQKHLTSWKPAALESLQSIVGELRSLIL